MHKSRCIKTLDEIGESLNVMAMNATGKCLWANTWHCSNSDDVTDLVSACIKARNSVIAVNRSWVNGLGTVWVRNSGKDVTKCEFTTWTIVSRIIHKNVMGMFKWDQKGMCYCKVADAEPHHIRKRNIPFWEPQIGLN